MPLIRANNRVPNSGPQWPLSP